MTAWRPHHACYNICDRFARGSCMLALPSPSSSSPRPSFSWSSRQALSSSARLASPSSCGLSTSVMTTASANHHPHHTMITPCLHTEFHAAYLHRVPAAAVVYFWREGIPEDGKMRLPIPDTTDPPTSDLIAGTRHSLSVDCALPTPHSHIFFDGLARGGPCRHQLSCVTHRAICTWHRRRPHRVHDGDGGRVRLDGHRIRRDHRRLSTTTVLLSLVCNRSI